LPSQNRSVFEKDYLNLLNYIRKVRQTPRALKELFNLDKEQYLCPICLRPYSKKAISAKDLTAEHVPQKSIKGKEILLTCRKCNSESGHEFEGDLKEREKLKSFIKALNGEENLEGRIKVEVTMGGQKINTHTHIKDGKIDFKIPKDYNHPANLEHIFDHLDEIYENQSWSKEKFNIQPDIRFSKRNIALSDLKTAYLASFALLGYSYILNKEFDIIRQQILNPKETLVQRIFLRLPKRLKRERKIISIEKPFKSITVQIDERMVFLPQVENPVGSLGEIKNYLVQKNKELNLSGTEFPWPKSLIMTLDFKD